MVYAIFTQMDVKTIATHNTGFHADDVFAIAILRKLYPSAKIIRTRDLEELRKADIRVDVGFKYNPKTGDYDHHQAGGAGKRASGVEYAACGLIWKHFGEKLCSPEVLKNIDENFVQFIDAEDTGAVNYDEKIPPVTISEIIKLFYPFLNQSNYDELFMQALHFASTLIDRLLEHTKLEEAAKAKVREALKNSKEYVVLEKYLPWKDVVIKESSALYVVYPSVNNEDWSAYAVPISPKSFKARKQFPLSWAGKADEDLAKITGVKDAIFCHNNLFIAKAKTKEGAIKLAKLAINS